MVWNGLILLVAIACETIATGLLKMSDGMSRLWPSVGMLDGYLSSLFLLSVVLKSLSVGPATPTGLGSARPPPRSSATGCSATECHWARGSVWPSSSPATSCSRFTRPAPNYAFGRSGPGRTGFEKVRGLYPRGEAGDALFIPKGKWHTVVALEPSISLAVFGLTPAEVVINGGWAELKGLFHRLRLYRWGNCACHKAR